MIGVKVFDRTPAIFGMTIAESRKYAPNKSMKLPKTTGYGLLINLIIVFDARYVTIMTATSAAAA